MKLVDLYQLHRQVVDARDEGVGSRSLVRAKFALCLASSTVAACSHRPCVLHVVVLLALAFSFDVLQQLQGCILALGILQLLGDVQGLVGELLRLLLLSVHGVDLSNGHQGRSLTASILVVLADSQGLVGGLEPLLHLPDHALTLPEHAVGIGQEGFLPLELLGDADRFFCGFQSAIATFLGLPSSQVPAIVQDLDVCARDAQAHRGLFSLVAQFVEHRPRHNRFSQGSLIVARLRVNLVEEVVGSCLLPLVLLLQEHSQGILGDLQSHVDFTQAHVG
mmetsp:Transcript_33768/g.78431  ORF Transcript_33768/g.78431 Transcript_33768/m.78431 type:complete len:278 (+) Transcript_33768:240-1073(+)